MTKALKLAIIPAMRNASPTKDFKPAATLAPGEIQHVDEMSAAIGSRYEPRNANLVAEVLLRHGVSVQETMRTVELPDIPDLPTVDRPHIQE